uniref:ABC transporter domain-containing protein n=1 Tax=Panagrellus redivivus TaxID=6233 RepID=A0A7E4WCV7_PANRE
MDECEVLCSRIGFLNNGSLISIGSSQHLKSRFGNSFLLTLTVTNPSENNLKYLNIIVMKKFGAKPTQDPEYMNVLHWEIPRRAEDLWSNLYRRAHEIANCHHPTFAGDTPMITDFSYVPPKVTPIATFAPVDVTGDYNDITRTVFNISRIASHMCNHTSINIGFVYPNTTKTSVMQLFKERYVNEHGSYKIVPQKFDSLDEMRTALYNDNGSNKTGADCGKYIGGIYVSTLNVSKRQFAYSIFVRDSYYGWHTNQFWPDDGPYGDSAIFSALSRNVIPLFPPYWTSGFLSFQRALDSIFLKMVGKPESRVQLNRFPTPQFQIDGAFILINSTPAVFVYLVVGVLLHTTKEIVSEKESGIRTHLLVMGLDSLAFYGSHFVIAVIKIMVVMGISSIILANGFEHISMFLFVPFCLLFSIPVVLTSILVSVCFRKSSLAIVAIFIIWFGMCKLDEYLDLTPTRIGSCFLGSLNIYTAFRLGVQVMGSFESRMIRLNWLNMFAESTVSFSVGCAFLMLILDIFLMLVLIYYFDNVWPTDDSPRKHPLFFLPCIGKEDLAAEFDFIPTHYDDTNIEPDLSVFDEADISVRKVTKIYETGQVAVDGLSFEAYRGQLTVLLGHNGAGKSTTFSVISGISASTRGEVYICRRSIEYELSECQKEIGYCPQYNPLFKKLTVEEHLRLYGKLKSDIWDRVGEERITRLLNKTNLTEKRNEYADKLSGGMKRKLCVAMALVGNSRVVLLDEPTAGMDPEARLDIAKMLKDEKRNRTILLTTHNMDEADLLADQIAIMCKGRLVCKGSSEYLKNRFGTGYNLTLVVGGDAAVFENKIQDARNALMIVIKRHVPTAKLDNICGMQFSVRLPAEDKNAFVHLFEELETRKAELDLLSFGLSLSTLEQVFLRVGEIAEPSENVDDYENMAGQAAALFGHHEYEPSSCTLFWNQVLAILQRYAINNGRHKLRFLVLIIMLTVVSIIASGGLFPTVKQARNLSLLKQEAFTIPMQFSPADRTANFTYFASKIPQSKPINFPQNVSFSEKVIKHGYDAPALGIGVQVVNKTYRMFFNGAAFHSPPLALSFLSNSILNESVDSIITKVQVYSPDSNDASQKQKSDNGHIATLFTLSIVCFSILTSLYVMPLVEDRVSCFKHQLLLTKLNRVTYWFAVTLYFLIFYVFFCTMYLSTVFFSKMMVIPTSYLAMNILLYLLYFWAAAPFSYVASFGFTSPARAFVGLLSYNLIVGPIAGLTLSVLNQFQVVSFIDTLYWIFYIMFPSFAFADSLTEISRQCVTFGFVVTWGNIRKIIICMIISGCFWWVMIFLLEHTFERIIVSIKRRFRNGYESLSNSQIDPDPEEPIDEDVRNEEFRVHETPSEDLALSVRDISKSFGNFHALRGVTFGVNPNDCFGLLGVNGAGKTTTFDIITGRTLATSGNAHVSGVDIRQMPVIGYCPQFDALPTDLTGRQSHRFPQQRIPHLHRLQPASQKPIWQFVLVDADCFESERKQSEIPERYRYKKVWRQTNNRSVLHECAALGNSPSNGGFLERSVPPCPGNSKLLEPESGFKSGGKTRILRSGYGGSVNENPEGSFGAEDPQN